jgi:FG-GAP-like repeat
VMGASFAGEAKEVAVADFNGDGKLDIAAIGSAGQIAILYGNGDGTFKAPVYIAIDSNDGFTALVTADFDASGTPDLGLLTEDGVLWLLYNDGKGNFTQQGVPIDSQPAGFTTTALVVGDFNADGRPDIAWVEQNSDQSADNTVWSALNTSKGIFSAKHEVGTLPVGFGNLLSADLDLDGKSDLVTWTTQLEENCCTELPVTAYYSTGSGTFTSSVLTSAITDDVGVTDINADGNQDVLIAGNAGVTVLLGNGNRTFANAATYTSLPGGAMQLGIGFFNDTDRMGFAAPNGGANAGGYPNDVYLVANDNAQLNCPYRSGAGVYFCQALQNGNSALVRGTARAQTQPVERIELWANGKKLYQVFADEFDATLNVAPGTQITAVEVEANGTTKSTTVTPSSVQTCDAPSSPGVNVCAPTQGENTTSPVLFRAAGRGASGSVNHLELWIDGNKIGNYSGSTMDASIAEATGSHSAQVVEVDSKGAYVKSAVVNFTVGGQTGPCSAPSAPGVHVCEPTAGESSASPVSFLAAGTGASGSVNHLELWIDGTKIGNYSGGDLETSVSEPAGSHTATVIEVDSKGAYVKSTPVTYTVK